MHISQIQKSLKLATGSALQSIARRTLPHKTLSSAAIEIGIPKDHKHGDLTSNIALRLAKEFSTGGVKLAGLIKEALAGFPGNKELRRVISRIEVSTPGFINFWFSEEYLHTVLSDVSREKKRFGKSNLGGGRKVNIEFVSANPTGPLTVAHGRQAAVGDALGKILEFAGYGVCREYFINDVGNQIDLLGKSIRARYLEEKGKVSDFPEDGYRGEYIQGIARHLYKKYGKKFFDENPKNLRFISEFGASAILEGIKRDLASFGVFFDKWFSQRALSACKVKDALNKLEKKGYVYKKDGAVWFRSTAFGDDKDRVVIKTDGAFTYLAPDIAYHLDKYRRNFDKLIDIWGPDHHGYIPRLKASIEAMGYDKKSISILIVQLATLFRGGAPLSMSTRKGEFITLSEVVKEVGSDVTKFFFLMRKLDSHLDFDLEVAKKSSLDNPVYYIQYAHARISSILNFSKKLRGKLKKIKYASGAFSQPEEFLLLRLLAQFPIAVEVAARTLEPYRMIEYLNELAKVFHKFYTKHRVVTDDDLPLAKARLFLVDGIRVVLANGLSLLGISFPKKM